MPIVSSVIHNRLKKGMKLQMDGTLNYGIYSNEVVTAERIRDDNTTYNTYKVVGLPTDPVCAVSLEAIKAAIFPVKSDYYSIIDLNQSTLTLNEAKYQKLLKEQLAWLNANYIQVKDKSYKLYTLYNKGKLPETMRERCCNFKLLEEKCLKYTIIDRSLHG